MTREELFNYIQSDVIDIKPYLELHTVDIKGIPYKFYVGIKGGNLIEVSKNDYYTIYELLNRR